MFRLSASSQAGRTLFKVSRTKRLKRALVQKAIRATKQAVPPKRHEIGPPTGQDPTPLAA